MREISALANVNHGLLHRHFGSKEELLSQILDRHVSVFRAELARVKSAEDAVRTLQNIHEKQPSFVRMLAFLILEQREIGDFTRQTGGTAAFRDILHATGIPDNDAKDTAAILTAFMLGWALFKGFATTAAGCDGSDARRLALSTSFLELALERTLSSGGRKSLDGLKG